MASIDQSNFRTVAQDAIKKYRDTGQIIDALVWSRIIELYESNLPKEVIQSLTPPVSNVGT